MKKILLITAALFFCFLTNAQVGINTTTPDPSSMLDITATDKGMLIPRMTEVQRTAITAPATGLLVYQTDNTDGFWYFNGVSWSSLSGGEDNDWNIVGSDLEAAVPGSVTASEMQISNTGRTISFGGIYNKDITDQITDYALLQNDNGTTYLNSGGGNALHFRTDNTEHMTMLNNGNVGIGTANPLDKFQVDGGRVEITSNNDASGTVDSGTLEIANSLRLDGNEVITNEDTALYIQNDNNGDLVVDNYTFMVDASTNRVGVGTNNPDVDLHVEGNFKLVNGSEGVGKVLTSSATGLATWQNSDDNDWNISGNNLHAAVNGNVFTETAAIGNTGRGNGFSAFYNNESDATTGYAIMQSDNGETYINSGGSNSLHFRTDNSEKITVLNNGNVGIGYTTPGEKLTVVGNTDYVARFVNTSDANGINIKINTTTPANKNNFITFSNISGTTVGRIEGETLAELETNDDYILDKTAQDLAIAMATIDVAISGVGIAIATADVTAAATSSSVCIPPICVTSPVPSLIVAASANLAAEIANGVVVAAGLTDAIAYQVQWVNNMKANIGVTYQSGAGDYAEWLPKKNVNERMIPGYVVGIKNGYISLDTKNAEKILAISTNPIVLGNSPLEDRENDFEKVAFMGQVPIRVLGKVNAGDYIVPSGNNDGYAKAIAPALMTVEDYGRIVGVAWTKSEDKSPVSLINVAMGLNDGDIHKVVVNQQNEIDYLKEKLAAIDEKLNNILNGSTTANDIQIEVTTKENHKTFQEQFQENIPNEDQIVYYYVNIEEMEKGLELAEKQFIEAGGNVNVHPFWSKIKSEPNFKASVVQKMKQKFDDAVNEFKRLNR